MQKQMLSEILHIMNEANNRRVHSDHMEMQVLTRLVCDTEKARVDWMWAVIGNINLN